jgi:hypothetical protein
LVDVCKSIIRASEAGKLTSAQDNLAAQARIHALSLYFVFYNFVRIHKTLRVTPAMQAGIADRLWTMEDVVALIDAKAPVAQKRGPYKKRTAST